MSVARDYDVVSIGESMIRYSPEGAQRLEQARRLELHVGGSESNTLAGLSRLGLQTCWISRLTNNAMGRLISGAVAAHGVDAHWIRWTDKDRVGVYYFEPGEESRPSVVIYDRAHSAFSSMTPDDIPHPPLQRAKLFHATGISLALTDSVRRTLLEARKIATNAGAKVSFDFNYRAKLWTMAEARVHCDEWIEQSDLVFIALRDASDWLGIEERISEESVFARLLARRAKGSTVMTLGAHGAMACDGRRTVSQGTIPVHGVGRLGAGDAFSAGYLYGWMQGWELEKSLQWANAAARNKLTTPGDLPWFTRQELERSLGTEAGNRLIR
ncbi:MAG: sugar kinase [Planctomycetota bacterium]